MKAIILAMSGLLALANAAPHPSGYGYDNNFSGHQKPLTGSYSNCKVEWRTVNKAGYKEVIEEKPKTVYVDVCKYVYQTECKNVKVPYTDYVTECEEGYEDKCEEQWVCLDDPKPESLKYCKNKQWEATDECVKIKVDHCKDVQKTFHKYEEKCDTKKVEKCEDVPRTIYEPIHKRVPTQIEGKIAFRVCDGESDHEYTPEEVRTIDFSEHQS